MDIGENIRYIMCMCIPAPQVEIIKANKHYTIYLELEKEVDKKMYAPIRFPDLEDIVRHAILNEL